MKSNTLKITNGTLELKAEGWNDVRKMLKKVQFICKLHDLELVYVEHRGLTMMVEPDSDIEQLAQEFEAWEKGKKEKRSQRCLRDSNEDHRWELVRGGHREEGGLR